jgi:hypothetical protein
MHALPLNRSATPKELIHELLAANDSVWLIHHLATAIACLWKLATGRQFGDRAIDEGWGEEGREKEVAVRVRRIEKRPEVQAT